MKPDVNAYLADPQPIRDQDYMGLQRAAMQELIRLSGPQADPIAEAIKAAHAQAKQELQEQFEVDKAEVETVFQSQSKQEKARFREQVDIVEAEYKHRLSAVNADAGRKRDQTIRSLNDKQEALQKEHQDKLMVTEFVSEGSALKAQQQHKATAAAGQANRRLIDSLAEQAELLLRAYRRRLPEVTSSPQDIPPDADAGQIFQTQRDAAQAYMQKLETLPSARVFMGWRPALWALTLIALNLGVALWLHQQSLLGPMSLGAALAVGALLGLVETGLIGILLWIVAGQRIRRLYPAFHLAVETARQAHTLFEQSRRRQMTNEMNTARQKNATELQRINEVYEKALQALQTRREKVLTEIEAHRAQAEKQLTQRHQSALQEAQTIYDQAYSALEEEYHSNLKDIEQSYERAMTDLEHQTQRQEQRLLQRWKHGLSCIDRLLTDTQSLDKSVTADWNELLTDAWTPPEHACSLIRLGSIPLDLDQVSETVIQRTGQSLQAKGTVDIPALLAFPDQCSLLLESNREGRTRSINTLRTAMMRLFVALPPGQVRFSIIDPVGLGESFAGFMHAGDYQENLVGGRIWTETQQIQQQLEELTQHMENVIQKYLRNEFETIEQYNQQAGELAEPYRFLVIADFPTHVNEESARRLSSIVHSGARCGVHTLIAYDTRQNLPDGIDIEDISANSLHLIFEHGRFVCKDPLLRRFALTLDDPPEETLLTQVMHTVGRAGMDASRVEIPFASIAPTDDKVWSRDSREELAVPMGRTGATRLQDLRLGRGVSQHVLIAGKTGSGKSTLLHVVITNLALWYGPDDVELYLIDFKKGVEFKPYVTSELPHARAVAIESDREFGLSILERLLEEMTHRGELFRRAGVQDIAAYRQNTGKKLPRTVLIVDEFQVFFAEDDKLAQDAAVSLEQLVRQGRAFGIHVILGSQTLGGAFGLARSTMGQMAVRIALQCSEADSQLILDDDNVAARLLSRPGEAIYNDAGGRVAGNSPFQVAWLPDRTRDTYLERLAQLDHAREQVSREGMIVFEGNQPADIRQNRQLVHCLQNGSASTDTTAPRVWLGAPVSIKDPVSLAFRRQSGANCLIIGQRDDVSAQIMSIAMICLAAQQPKDTRFVLMDGTPADSPLAGRLTHIVQTLPQSHEIVSAGRIPETIAELAKLTEQRVLSDRHTEPAVFILINGLQHYRMLRRSEDSFGFSMDQEAPPKPDAQLASILRDGPSVGVHVIAWIDTLASLERCLDRLTLREFDYRILFQMSAVDSSNLIDSPAANQLGLHRALLYSEEQGGIEKFRPYAPLTDDWLAEVRKQLETVT